MRWFLVDVLGLFSINEGPFSRKVVPGARIFSINLVPKQWMFPVPAIYVLGPLQLGWEHIILTGDYVWQQSQKAWDGQFRPLRNIEKP
jgi:hypothetical protein